MWVPFKLTPGERQQVGNKIAAAVRDIGNVKISGDHALVSAAVDRIEAALGEQWEEPATDRPPPFGLFSKPQA